MGSLEVDATPELATVLEELKYASKCSDPALGPQSYKSRIEIVSKAKQITNAVRDPQDLAFSQSGSVSMQLDQSALPSNR